MNRPCPVSIPTERCPGSDSPILNFSSELADQLYFIGVGYTPYNPWAPTPLGGGMYTAADCYGVEFSVASQEIADLLAQANATICQGQPSVPVAPVAPVVTVPPVPARVPFYNTVQSASGGCSSLAVFTYVVPPGTFVVMAYPEQGAGAEAEVNAKALAWAQQRVVSFDFCVGCTDPLNLKACVGQVYSSTGLFVMRGAAGNVNWTSSGLPPGVHLSPGTTTGVTDSNGDSWVRTGANRWTNLTTGASQSTQPQGTNSSTTGTADLLGTATHPGNYNFTVTATASNGNSSTWHGTFSVLGFSIFALPPAEAVLPNGNLCVGYNYQFAATGGTPPYTFFNNSQVLLLPTGLDIRNGALIGNPGVGTYHLNLGVRDSLFQECTQLFVLTIDPSATMPSIPTASPLPNGHANHPYFMPIAVIGGCPPYTMTVDSGTLPAGFQLAYSGGWELFGFPGLGQVGGYSFVLKAIDSAGQTILKPFTLTIDTNAVVTGSCINNGAIVASGTSPQLTAPGGSRPTASAEMTQAAAINNLVTNLQGFGCDCPPSTITVDPAGPNTTFTNLSSTCTLTITVDNIFPGSFLISPGATFNYAAFYVAFNGQAPIGLKHFHLGGGVVFDLTY